MEKIIRSILIVASALLVGCSTIRDAIHDRIDKPVEVVVNDPETNQVVVPPVEVPEVVSNPQPNGDPNPYASELSPRAVHGWLSVWVPVSEVPFAPRSTHLLVDGVVTTGSITGYTYAVSHRYGGAKYEYWQCRFPVNAAHGQGTVELRRGKKIYRTEVGW